MADPAPFVIRPTPNPNEFSFVTYVRSLWNVQLPTAGATMYRDWQQAISERAYENWGGYVYADAAEAPVGWLAFLWVKKKTETEKKTPFRSHTETGNHGWPMVLKSINFLQDPGFPITTQGPSGNVLLAARTYVREVLIPAASEGTLFKIEEFLSDTPFNVRQAPAPNGSQVSYDYLGCSGAVNDVLHDDIELPNLRTARQRFSTGSGNNSAFGATRGQIFPATPFTEWAPYITSQKVTYTEGQWYMVTIKAYPPVEPETITR